MDSNLATRCTDARALEQSIISAILRGQLVYYDGRKVTGCTCEGPEVWVRVVRSEERKLEWAPLNDAGKLEVQAELPIVTYKSPEIQRLPPHLRSALIAGNEALRSMSK